jgi:hypothetical protein
MLKKEQIKDRMLKTAARIWGAPEGEIESNFDPLVMLLLDACAAELEGIGAAINAAQSRLLDRLTELMLPEALINARPAAAVMHALPVEARAEIDDTVRFYTTQRVQQAGSAPYNADFHFTPIGRFSLLKASLSYLRAGSKLYRIGPGGQKEFVAGSATEGFYNELCLVITADKALKNLDGLQLFFDMKGHSEAAALYNSLHNATVYMNNQPVEAYCGYHNEQQFELNLQDTLTKGYDYSRKLQRHIAGIFRNQFLNIRESGGGFAPVQLSDWWQQLPAKVTEELSQESCIFLKIEFGRPFSQEALDRLHCSINALPVINRTFNQTTYRTDNWVNIVPLPVDGAFLHLASVTGAQGGPYKINISADTRQVGEGEAIVRSSGIGKTSSREVRAIIGSLMEAIRDESAYFSRMSNDFVMTRLREITRILAGLEDQMAVARDQKASQHYLMLRPRSAAESVSIAYWTTQGSDAHHVKAGAILNAHNHTITVVRGTYLLTNPMGGKTVISEAEKRYLLQRQLSSGGRVVSVEDVKLLAWQVFGERLKKVDVVKSINAGTDVSSGFTRSIDVVLTLTPAQNEMIREEERYLCRELEYSLSENASPIYPFQIRIA